MSDDLDPANWEFGVEPVGHFSEEIWEPVEASPTWGMRGVVQVKVYACLTCEALVRAEGMRGHSRWHHRL